MTRRRWYLNLGMGPGNRAGSTKEQAPAHTPKLHPLKWKHRASAYSSSLPLPLPLLVNLIFPAHYQEEGAASTRCGTEYIQARYRAYLPSRLPSRERSWLPMYLAFLPNLGHALLSLPTIITVDGLYRAHSLP